METADILISASAKVRPVSLPTGHLGESLVIAFVGTTSSDEPFTLAVTPKPLSCLPDDLGHAVANFGAIAVEDFLLWRNRARNVEDWTPPLTGLTLGSWIDVEGYDLSDLRRITLSLAALGGERTATTPRQSSDRMPRSRTEARFFEFVRAEVVRIRPQLSSGFKRELSLSGKHAGTEIDFVGNHYVTCYTAIDPKTRSAMRVQSAAAGLWRLARTRDAFGFAAPAQVELTAWIPSQGNPTYDDRDYGIVDETVMELVEQAKREALTVHTVTDHLAASRRLVDIESFGQLAQV